MHFRINDAENAVIFSPIWRISFFFWVKRHSAGKKKTIIDRESNAAVHQIETRNSTLSSDIYLLLVNWGTHFDLLTAPSAFFRYKSNGRAHHSDSYFIYFWHIWMIRMLIVTKEESLSYLVGRFDLHSINNGRLSLVPNVFHSSSKLSPLEVNRHGLSV